MAGVNKVILLGNVGQDPEVRHLDSGVSVARLRLATTESYKNKDGQKVDQTEWHSIVLWRGLAKVTEEYVKKGSQIYIEGRIRSNTWEDDKGNQRKSIEIQADSMQLLGRPPSSQNEGGYKQKEEPGQVKEDSPKDAQNDIKDGDDLPF